MNPFLTVIAAAALLAPAAAFGYDQLADGASRAAIDQASAPGASSAGNLRVVLAHAGDEMPATLRVEAPGFSNERAVTLRAGEPAVVAFEVARGEVSVELSSFTFTGANRADLLACDEQGVVFQFDTRFRQGVTPVDGASGIRVRDATCAGEPAVPAPADEPAPAAAAEEERVAGRQTIGVAANAPYPTCPTSCTVGYSFFGSGGVEVPVREGATRIDVVARWTPTTPLTETLRVGVYVRDDPCGEGCWMGVAGEKGAREVSFSLDDPAPATHRVSAHLAGPGAGARQDVEFEVLVHYS